MTADRGVQVIDVTKRYGSTQALAGVTLDIRPGEILGIAGPNGAGKSTLVRILDGEESPDSGELRWRGEPWDPVHGPRRVTVVHQEPQLFPTVTVGDNLKIGRESFTLGKPRLDASEREVLGQFGIDGYADRTLAECSLPVRQFTALSRALIDEAELFLFDEPNSALTEEESTRLFEFMRALAAAGKLTVLITHRLAELAAVADRVALILDGRCAVVLEGDDVEERRIARELVGGIDAAAAGRPPHEQAKEGTEQRAPILRAAGWTHPKEAFADVDLEVSTGEILAMVGVEGSGGRELLASFAGLEPGAGTVDGGEGRPVPKCTFVAADRRSSLFPNLSVASNLVSRLGVGRIAGRARLVRRKEVHEIATDMRKAYGVRARSVDQSITTLSGGNQQKVAIASALAQNPTVLLLEEPTRGVDVGSKAEIYRLLRDFVGTDRAAILFCTEVVEAYEAADRVIVMDRGRPVGSLEVATYKDLPSLAAGVAATREEARSTA